MVKTHKAALFAAFLGLFFAAPASALSVSSAEKSLLSEMNRVRSAEGLPALRLDPRLQRAARVHSSQMLRYQVFSHGSFIVRLRRFGIRSGNVGENLAWGTGAQATPRAIVSMWLSSPSHRANLLGRNFTRVGVGSLVGTFSGFSGARVVTADFAG